MSIFVVSRTYTGKILRSTGRGMAETEHTQRKGKKLNCRVSKVRWRAVGS
jgi:hypothetical protein